MGKFILGIIVTLVVGAIVVVVCSRMGLVDMRADQKIPKLERVIAGPAMDASVERNAPKINNPVQPTDDNLKEGMVIYTMNCAVCHGSPSEPISKLGRSEYPPAPQFVKFAPDMEPNQNYYITKHGIRWTAMPSWDKVLTDDQIWKVVAFLSTMDKLPPSLQQQWQGNAAPAPASK